MDEESESASGSLEEELLKRATYEEVELMIKSAIKGHAKEVNSNFAS